jgi:hypothetical protein
MFAEFLRNSGLQAHNITGGIDAYRQQIDPTLPVY